MKHITAFRTASVLLIIFCALHTAGGMLGDASMGAASDQVLAQMRQVHFDFNGSDATWYGFWFGFGLTVSAFLLLSAAIAWTLDRVPREDWSQVNPIAWALIVSHVVNTVLAWQYFFAGPVVFGIAITSLLTFGTLNKSRKAAMGREAPLASSRG
jgi:hypothetical protein